MADPGSASLIACDTLAEARELAAKVRAGLPVLALGSPVAGSAAGRGRPGAADTPVASADARLFPPTPDPPAGATDPRQHLAALQYRLDRLEQTLTTAGTFA